MVFYMSNGSDPDALEAMAPAHQLDSMTPAEVVRELDRYIVGQEQAKRAVAVALRNRWRRRQLPPGLAEEILPKNILMIGPTGVGKTEIARRLARLTASPFLKIEATKYTEVGYVGRDCESMVRDLVEIAIEMEKQQRRREMQGSTERAVEDQLLDALARNQGNDGERPARLEAREELRKRLRAGELEELSVEIEVSEAPPAAFKIGGAPGMDEIDVRLGDMMPGVFSRKNRKQQMMVSDARIELLRQEEEKRLGQEDVTKAAIRRVEQTGILFIDELDKIAIGSQSQGPDVSRQGVQRDLLPIIEGTIVQTKHGPVHTDHVLFITAGAFHMSKPSDLVPELQGRLPIRVELTRLGRDELVRILTEPEGSLLKQYKALLAVDGVELDLQEDAVQEIARIAEHVNERTEDIGARRLATILERLLEHVLFDAPDTLSGRVVIDAGQVRDTLGELASNDDFARYVL